MSEINKILKSYQFMDNSSSFPSHNLPASITPPVEVEPIRSAPQSQHIQNPQIQPTQYVVSTQPTQPYQQQYQMLPKQVPGNLSQSNFAYPPPPPLFLPQTQSQPQLQSQPNIHQLPPQPPQPSQPPQTILQSNAQSQQPVSYRPPSTSNIVIRAGQFEYPRFDNIKTHTTFYSKNNVYSDFGSSSSLGGGANFYPNHQRNPSIQVQEGLANGNIVFSNYCSACGRSCGCARTFNENFKQ
ncbi:MAG: hypothetical protein E6Q89_02975 [Bacteroidia bacterium]|nr:MAG: hypothetical protein E6Q89_02975 [Bacteroidia bacterium]